MFLNFASKIQERRMKRRLFYILTLLLIAAGSTRAQFVQYEEMREMANEHSLPLVNIIVDITKVNRTDFVRGEIEVSDYQRRTNPSSNTTRFHCLYRIRGGSATNYEKKSFAVKLIDEDGADLDANIFGIREENSWILDAMAIDRIRMRNRICFDVWNDLSQVPYETKYERRNGTKGVLVEVFINGDYHGLYCMSDKIDRKLLGLKKAKVSDDGSVEVKGLLYKGINWKSAYNLLSYKNEDVNKDTWNAWELQYPDDYPSIDTWKPLMNLIDFCSRKTSNEAFHSEYQNYFHTDNLLDYIVFTLVLNIGDNGYKNTFLSVVDISKGHCYLLTPWDMDMSLGGNWYGDYYDYLASADRYNSLAPFNRLLVQNIDGFKDALSAKWCECYETLFSVEDFSERLDSYANMFVVSGAWERERNRWNGNPVPLKENLFDEIQYVKDWYERNYLSLCEHFGTEPTGIATTENNKVLPGIYTLDGRKTGNNNTGNLRKGIYIVGGKKILF